MAISSKHTRLIGTAVVLAVLAGSVSWAVATRYRGLVRGSRNQLLYSSMHENRNLAFLIGYWLKFMQLLRLDSKTGVYNFNETPVDGLDELTRGQLEYHRGNFENGRALINAFIRRNGASEEGLFWLALTDIRLAENDNCVPVLRGTTSGVESSPHDHATMCALPVERCYPHPSYAEEAASTLTTLLDRYDANNRLYRWLLNFTHMTLGDFPGGVPERYVIRTSFIDQFYGRGVERARASHPEIRFEDQARQLGVNVFHPGRGAAVEDFDGDGYADIVTGGSFGPVRFYKNDRGRGFIDRTAESGLAGIRQVFAIVAADYDNDGNMDLFICRPFDHYVLYRNNGNGTFTDVTAASGLLDSKRPDEIAVTWIPAFADVNNDGKLDLFIAQWAFKLPFVSGVMARPRMDSALFINDNGRFVNRTREYGLEKLVHDYYYIGAAFGDYDGDGYPDLFLSSPLRASSVLLHNSGGKRFEETRLIQSPASGFTAAFLDVNHDGRLDIFQAGFGDAITAVEQVVFGEHADDHRSGHSAFFIQTAQGTFERHEEAFDMPMSTMGASFGDINNDGCYDFYLGKGDPEPWFVLPNLMYVGRTNGTECSIALDNVSMLEGLGNVQKGHGIVFFDFNNDGKQDIFSALGGMWPGDSWTSQLFVNKTTSTNTWTKIRLRGRRTNASGIGARVRVRAENAAGREIVRYALPGAGTGFGNPPSVLQVGLLNATRIKSVDVYWPVSRCAVTYPAQLETVNLLDEEQCWTRLTNASVSAGHAEAKPSGAL